MAQVCESFRLLGKVGKFSYFAVSRDDSSLIDTRGLDRVPGEAKLACNPSPRDTSIGESTGLVAAEGEFSYPPPGRSTDLSSLKQLSCHVNRHSSSAGTNISFEQLSCLIGHELREVNDYNTIPKVDNERSILPGNIQGDSTELELWSSLLIKEILPSAPQYEHLRSWQQKQTSACDSVQFWAEYCKDVQSDGGLQLADTLLCRMQQVETQP